MFANLHTHTEYSLLDGLSKIPALLDRARALGQEAMAITDHGGMYGVIEFYQQARKREMKPIIGLEGYVAPGSRHSRDPREKNAYYHLTLLARDYEGYKNLMALTTLSNLEGYYYKPRMDREILERHGKGLIALSGCPSGEVFKALLDNDPARAKATLDFFKGVFDDVYLEIQDHPDAKGELRGMLDTVNPRLIELSRHTGLPLVATNDSHYTMPEDAHTHEVLLCIGTTATMNDPKRFRLEGDSYFVKSEAEMLAIFNGLEEAVANTMRVADACDLTLDFGRINMPEPELPPGKTPQEHLADVCRAGLIRRYGSPSEAHVQRLDYELHVIEVTGFASYMLIVAEIARAAAERRIPMGVRGSAAASIVLYCLGVTDIDPIATRLVFERFLNVERREMPDVDMDFADDRRGEMIRWAAERYGHDRVAQIITFGTLGAKAAIRDTGRALGMTLSDTDRVARMIPTALHMTIDRALAENIEFKQAYDADANVRKLVDTAKKLEGVARNAGTHAAGVVIAGQPLIELVPLQKPARGDESALPVTQFEMGTVAEVGLLKMDFLGLSNLTILAKALDLIKEQRGIEIDLKQLQDGDARTYELLSRGETFAVFQLESAGMRRYIQELKPASIAELSAMVALYRPGPMQHIPRFCNSKHGKEPISYPHPALAEILDETYGVIVYQDQVLFILRQFAGYTMGEADKVRKAMGKKIAEMMRAEREKFIKGAKKQGYTDGDASAVFDLIEPFAGYAFNKCVVGETIITHALTGERTTVGDLFARPRPFLVHALGEDGRLRPRPVTHISANGTKPVFELRTAQGNRITATGNHPFRTLDGWTNLEALRVGDRIAMPRRLPSKGDRNWPEHEVIALAGLLSEGNTCHPSTLYFYNNDMQLVDDFTRAASRFPNTIARVATREHGRLVVSLNTGRDTRFSPGGRPWNARHQTDTAIADIPRRSGIYGWAEQLGITWKKAPEKRIPDDVFRLSDAQIALFLGRLWSGDGFIADATTVVPFYATSSRALAVGVQALLLRLGIVCGVHEKHFAYRGSDRPGWTVHLVGEDAIDVFAERVLPHVVGRETAIARLHTHLRSTRRAMTAADTVPADVRASSRLRSIADSDIFWDRVVAIEPRGEQPTFDLTVDRDHNFVADGLIVHNSHSVCYGTIAYQTAWLKANYPAEYMTAVLSLADSHPSGFAERVGAAVSECAKLGIQVLPPSVNHSDVSFSVERGDNGEGQAIRFGLATIKNAGTAAVEGIVAARREGGPYQSLEDFCRRAELKGFNKRTLESLIKAGALDCFEHNRTTLATNLDRISSLIQREQRLKESGQSTMFDLFGDEVSTPLPALELETLPYQQGECLTWERDLLGVYVSEHPYRRAHGTLAKRISAVIAEVTEEMAGRELAIAGMVASVRTLLTKAGKTFAAAVVEDLSGSVEVTCWPDVYERTREYWQQGTILLLSVRVRQRDERLDVTVNDVGVWDERTDSVQGGASITPPAPATAPSTATPAPDDGWGDEPAAEEDDGEWGMLDSAPPAAATRGGVPPMPEPAGLPADAAPANSNGHGGQSNAGNNGQPSVNGNGNGNGRGPRNGYGRNSPPPAPIPTSDRDRRLLRITLNETADESSDRRRLNELVQILRSLPGEDEVRLVLRTAHDQYMVNFGTALVTDAIDQRLAPVLSGWGEMAIESLRTD